MGKRTNPKLPSPRDVTIFERVAVGGERQSAVARECGLSRQRVNKICDRVGHLVFQELIDNVAEHRRQTLLRLENLYSQALKAWHESKSVRCLTEARLALSDVRRMCGLDIPEKEILEVISVQQRYEEIRQLPLEQLENLSLVARLCGHGTLKMIPNSAEQGGGYLLVERGEAESHAVG